MRRRSLSHNFCLVRRRKRYSFFSLVHVVSSAVPEKETFCLIRREKIPPFFIGRRLSHWHVSIWWSRGLESTWSPPFWPNPTPDKPPHHQQTVSIVWDIAQTEEKNRMRAYKLEGGKRLLRCYPEHLTRAHYSRGPSTYQPATWRPTRALSWTA